MDFRRQRGFLLDKEDPPDKVGSYFLVFMYVDVSRDFVGDVSVIIISSSGSGSRRRRRRH